MVNIELDPTREELVCGLVDINGQPIGKTLVEKSLLDPHVQRLEFLGQPGSGKTGLRRQINGAQARNAKALGLYIVESEVIYDDELKGTDLHYRDKPRFNRRLVRKITHPNNLRVVNFIPGVEPKHISNDEFPAVGKTDIKDRGVTAAFQLAEVADEEGIVFLYKVANYKTQAETILTRHLILHTQIKSIVPRLRAERNIFAELEGGGEDLVALGKMLQSETRWAANEDHISTIRDEVQYLDSNWYRANEEYAARRIAQVRETLPESYRPAAMLEYLVSKVQLPINGQVLEGLKRDSQAIAFNACLEAAHAESRFSTEMHLAPDRYIIAFGPHIDGPVHWPLKHRRH